MAKKTNKTSHVLNLITNGGSGDSGAEQEELKEVPEKKESEQEIKGEDAPEKEASLPAADKEMPVKVVSSGEKRVIVVDESSQNQKIENQILDNLTNHLEEEFKTTVFIDVPLESQGKTIYDGNIHVTENCNFAFYRYQ